MGSPISAKNATTRPMAKLDLFRNEREWVRVQAGQTIFESGQSGDTMYVVLEGEVELTAGSKVIETVSWGGIFGEMALIDKAPRSARAIAKTDCKLAVLNEKRFTYLVQNTPYFSMEVMKIMADRLRRGTGSEHRITLTVPTPLEHEHEREPSESESESE